MAKRRSHPRGRPVRPSGRPERNVSRVPRTPGRHQKPSDPEDETEEEFLEFDDEDVDDDDLTTPPPVIQKYEPPRPPMKKKKKTAGLALPDGDPSDEPLPLPPEAALAAMKGNLSSKTLIQNIEPDSDGKPKAAGVILNDERLQEMIQDGIEKTVVSRGVHVENADRERLIKLVRGELAARIKDFESIRVRKAGLTQFDKDDLERMIRSLETQIGDYKTLLEAKGTAGGDEQELDTLRRQIKNLEDSLANSEELNDENREKVKRLEKRESDIKEELELKKWDIQSLTDDAKELKARIAELEALPAQKQDAPSVNDDALKADIDRLLNEIQALKSRNIEIDSAYQALLVDHSKSTDNVKKAADRIETASKANAELKEQIADATAKAASAADALLARDAEIADLRQQLNARSAASDGNVHKLLNDLASKDSAIASLNAQNASLESLKRELAQRSEDSDSRAASLAKDLADARAALDKKTVAANNAVIDAQQKQSEIDALSGRLTDAERRSDALENENATLRDELQAAQTSAASQPAVAPGSVTALPAIASLSPDATEAIRRIKDDTTEILRILKAEEQAAFNNGAASRQPEIDALKRGAGELKKELASSSAAAESTDEDVVRLANHLFTHRGGVHGSDLRDWVFAEKILKSNEYRSAAPETKPKPGNA
ncbi:MAG: hypothetical protein ABIH86_01965 [Planctomycetota bacterium]